MLEQKEKAGRKGSNIEGKTRSRHQSKLTMYENDREPKEGEECCGALSSGHYMIFILMKSQQL